MIKRKTIGLAAATALLGGLGAYGATTAFAASPSTDPRPTASTTASPDDGDGVDKDAMIRHCTDQLPADERDEARRQMDKMMSGGTDGMMSGSMMGGASNDDHHGMG